jgi:hypothetical protein
MNTWRKINSYSVVGNSRTKREIALLCYSIRNIHDTPIYIMCDQEVHDYISQFQFSNIEIDPLLSPEYIRDLEVNTQKVTKKNDFHHAGFILAKMDCMNNAIDKYGDTLFVDADLVFIQNPERDIDLDMECMLSPHYHVEDKLKENKEYGIYNAGYVWTNKKKFGDSWRDIYLNDSKFYEQEGMYHLMEYYDTATFPKTHNIGFWRFSKPWPDGKLKIYCDPLTFNDAVSLHFHAYPENYAHANEGLTAGYDQLKNICWDYLPLTVKKFAESL